MLEKTNTFYSYLKQVASENKREEKINLLFDLKKEFPSLPEVLDYMTNPDYKWGISIKPMGYYSDKNPLEFNDENWKTIVKPVFDRLKAREITGNRAREIFRLMAEKFSVDSQSVIYTILNKNLKIGVGRTEFIKFFEVVDVVDKTFAAQTLSKKKFEVALANKYNPEKQNIFDGTYFLSRKLDGCRVICFIGDEIKFYSRNGKEFTTLGKVAEEIKNSKHYLYLKGRVLDGEICIIDSKGNENFQQVVGEVKRKDFTISNPCYKVFDIVNEDDFWKPKMSGKTLSERIKEYQLYLSGMKTISPCEQWIATEDKLGELLATVKEKGWEGIMARKNGPYENGRTNNLLKIKDFCDAEYKVEEVENGELNFNESGKGVQKITCVRALKINHKGCRVSVGSGLTKEQRIEWYKHPERILGKTITVKFFEETKAANGNYSLRFPTFLGVRDYE